MNSTTEALRKQLELEDRTYDEDFKERLLEKYLKGHVRVFTQFDGYPKKYHDLLAEPDWLMSPDKDGDILTGNHRAHEIRKSGVELGVRVQISEPTTKEDAVRLLKKIIDWIERDHIIELPRRENDNPHRIMVPLIEEKGTLMDSFSSAKRNFIEEAYQKAYGANWEKMLSEDKANGESVIFLRPGKKDQVVLLNDY